MVLLRTAVNMWLLYNGSTKNSCKYVTFAEWFLVTKTAVNMWLLHNGSTKTAVNMAHTINKVTQNYVYFKIWWYPETTEQDLVLFVIK